MNKFMGKTEKLWRRAVPLLLAFCLLSAALLPAFTAKAVIINTEGDPKDVGGNTINVYRWTRVMNVKDLKKYLTKSWERKYCMIVYDDDNCCPNGFDGYGKIDMNGDGEKTDFGGEVNPWYCSGNEFIDFDDKNGVFFTPSLPGFAWQIALTGGSGSGSMPYVRLYHTYNNKLFRIGGVAYVQNEGLMVGPDANNEYLNLDKDWYYTRADIERMFTNPEWTLFGSDTSEEYSTPNGYFRFVKEVSGSNWQLAFNEDDDNWTVISNNDPAENAGVFTDYEGRFKLFIADEIPVPAIIKDMTIQSGSTFTVDNGVIVKGGVTITIEPGAVFTVKGVLYNNGIINNYGTMIVETDGIVSYFDPPKNADAGKIHCEGGTYNNSKYKDGWTYADGNLIVFEGGKIDFHESDILNGEYGSLELLYGASCINFGSMYMPRGLYVHDGVFENRQGGTVQTGKALKSSASSSEKSNYTKHFLYYISSAGVSTIENKGGATWKNYCDWNTSGRYVTIKNIGSDRPR